MKLSVYRNNIVFIIIEVDNASELIQKKEREDIININFESANYVDLQIGDFIIFERTQQRYYLLDEPNVILIPNKNAYTCSFKGHIHLFEYVMTFLNTPKVTEGTYSDYKFPLTGNASSFLDFIVGVLVENGFDIIAGVADETPFVTIEFNMFNVFTAIYEITNTLEIDWYFEDNILNFSTRTTEVAYVLQLGNLSGLRSIEKIPVDTSELYTVVYGYGSTDNLPPRTSTDGDAYDSPLLTENRLAFEGEDGESKLTKNTNLYGVRQIVKEFPDIRPEFTGEVTEVDENDRQVIFDTTIDFDINSQLMEGIFPKIKFLTGKLIGLTFNISFTNSTSKIVMDIYSDESGDYPNEIIYADIGDTFALFDIIMPTERIEAASASLKEATQEYIDNQSSPKVIYEGEIDPYYVSKYNIPLNIGVLVRIINTDLKLDGLFEIKELQQNLNNSSLIIIKFGDILPEGLKNSLEIINFNTSQEIYNIQKNSITNNQVTNIVGDNIKWQTL